MSNRRPALLAVIAASLLLSGCGLFGRGEKAPVSAPEVLYERAKTALDNGDFRNAARQYEDLEARFPFSRQTRQAKLDLMYAYYKVGDDETAIDAADQFARENPTHPRIDYTLYIKGLVYFERTPNIIERWFSADLSARPPQDARKSIQAFSDLIRRFPNSEYVHDARQRIVYLRNRLADYEVYVADYYLRRGAYVAAIARAKYCIETYDGAPAVRSALAVMIKSYSGLGAQDLADQAQQVYAMNFPDEKPVEVDKPWWKLF